MTIIQGAVLALFFVGTAKAAAHEALPTAFLGFTLRDTSLQGEIQGVRQDEADRLAIADQALHDALVRSGCCTPVDLSRVTERARAQDMQSCNGCDVALARETGAKIVITGWVQKVSNLILNMNIAVRDVATGELIGAGSVDFRGNTDESWSRALSYLVHNRLRPADW